MEGGMREKGGVSGGGRDEGEGRSEWRREG